jgi:hypothetical protein
MRINKQELGEMLAEQARGMHPNEVVLTTERMGRILEDLLEFYNERSPGKKIK